MEPDVLFLCRIAILFNLAGIRLALIHHDPGHEDIFLQNLEIVCQKRFPNAFFAREGAEFILLTILGKYKAF